MSINVSVKTETLSEEVGVTEVEKAIVLDKDSLEKYELPDYYDLENNNSPKWVMMSLERPR